MSGIISFFVVQNKALKSLLVTVLLFGGIICTVYPFQQCCSTSSTTNGQGKAKVDQCPVGGAPVGEKIAAIMGVEASSAEKKVAFVKYNYYGIDDCHKIADAVPGGGSKGCNYGCLGSGSCVKACQFDAIHVVNGVAVVDKEKCVACGKCAAKCPAHVII